MSLASRAASGAVFLSLSAIASIIIGFTSNIALARLLQPNDFGTFALANTLMAFVDIRGKLQLESKFVRDQGNGNEQFNTYFTIGFTLACVSLILLSIGATIVATLNRVDLGICLLILGALGLFEPLASAIRLSIEKQVAFRAISFIQMLVALTQFGFTLLAAWLGWGLWSLLAGTSASALVNLGLFLWIAPQRPNFRLNVSLAREFIQYGIKYGLVLSMSNTILTQFDNFIVGLMGGTYALGFYDRAYRTSLWPTLLISAALGRISLPAYSQLQNDPARLSRAFSIVLWIVLTCATPIGMVVLVISPDLVPILYGDKWLPSIPILQVLAAFVICRPLWDIMGSILLATKHQKQLTQVVFIQAVTLLCLAVPLTWLFSGIGTAISVGVAFLISAGFLVYFASTHLAIEFLKNIGLPLFNNIITVVLYFVLAMMLPMSGLAPWLRLGLEVMLYLGTYGIITLATSRHIVVERTHYIIGIARA